MRVGHHAGGMVLSCIVGVIIRALLGTIVVLAAPIAVALAVVAMQMTGTIHRERCFL